MVETDGFEGPIAEESPAIDGEVVDQVEFPLVLGQEFPDVGVFEGQKTVGGFAQEEDGSGEEAMFDSIAGGDALAPRGVRAGGTLRPLIRLASCCFSVGGFVLTVSV